MKRHIFIIFLLLILMGWQRGLAQVEHSRLVIYLSDSSVVTYPTSQFVSISHSPQLNEGITVHTTNGDDYYSTANVTRIEWERGGMEIVDLGLSVNWASCNIGASMPEDIGTFGAEPSDSVWRYPSADEIAELYELCDWKEVTIANQPCFLVTGTNGNSIIIPRVGYTLAGNLIDNGLVAALPYASGYLKVVSSNGCMYNTGVAPLRPVTEKTTQTTTQSSVLLRTLPHHSEDNTINTILLCAHQESMLCEGATAKFGFLASYEPLPTEKNSTVVWADFTDSELNNYYARFNILQKDSVLYYRAYAIVDGQKIYGEVRSTYDYSNHSPILKWEGLYNATSNSITLKAEATPIYKTENKDIHTGFRCDFYSDDGDTTSTEYWQTLDAPGYFTQQIDCSNSGVYKFSALREYEDNIVRDYPYSHMRKGTFALEGEDCDPRWWADMINEYNTSWEFVEDNTASIFGHGYLYIEPKTLVRPATVGLVLSTESQPQVLYGTYDISLRMLPISLLNDSVNLPLRFTAKLFTWKENESIPSRSTHIFKDEDGRNYFLCDSIQATTIHLGTYTFCGERAVLQLTSHVTVSQLKKYTKDMLIDRIMLDYQTSDSILNADTLLMPSTLTIRPTERYSLPTQVDDSEEAARRVSQYASSGQWQSDDETIATVNGLGIVTALKEGETLITNLSTKDTCLVKVSDNSDYYDNKYCPVTGIVCNYNSLSLFRGQKTSIVISVLRDIVGTSYQYYLNISSTDDSIVEVSTPHVSSSWESNSTDVNDYIDIAAVGTGTAYITITSENGLREVIKVEVIEPIEPTSIQLNTHEMTLSIDSVASLGFSIEPKETNLKYGASCSIAKTSIIGDSIISVTPMYIGSEWLYLKLQRLTEKGLLTTIKVDSCLLTITPTTFPLVKFERNDTAVNVSWNLLGKLTDATAEVLYGETENLTEDNSKTISATITSTTATASIPDLDPTKTYYALLCVTFNGDTYQSEVVTIEDTLTNIIDLGLSIKWTNQNLGATLSSLSGDYYAWGENSIKMKNTWSGQYVYDCTIQNYTLFDGESPVLSDIISIGTDGNISATEYDAVQTVLGNSYRMPTLTEMQELVEKCNWEVATYNGAEGFRVTGPSGESIFLPCTGTAIESSSIYACYWTAQRDADNDFCAYALYVEKDSDGKNAFAYIVPAHCWEGLSIRPVAQ